MAWLSWMRFFPDSDRTRFAELKKDYLTDLPENADFSAVAQTACRMAASRLAATITGHKSACPDLLSAFPFNVETREEVRQLIAPYLQPVAWSFPLDPESYPMVADIAAPFLDTFAPREGRRAMGFYCTPRPVATQLVEALDLVSAGSGIRLLDAGCGTGGLALRAFEILTERWPANDRNAAQTVAMWMNTWRLYELNADLAALCTLQMLHAVLPWVGDTEFCGWPVKNRDFLVSSQDLSCTHTLANPPFMGEKHFRERIRSALENSPRLAAAYRGKADLSFLFVLGLLESLVPGGRLAVLTPAYWPTSDSASGLRSAIISLADVLFFEEPSSDIPAATGISTLILSLRKLERPRLLITAAGEKEDAAGKPWRILESSEENRWLQQMVRCGRTLGGNQGPFVICAGIQSGADRVTRGHLCLFGSEQPKIGQGIFVLSCSEAQALHERMNEKECSLLRPLVKSPACGPFVLDAREDEFLLYLDGQTPLEELPAIAEHLESFKPILMQRRECRQGKMPWWRLHWPREQAHFKKPSLLAPQRATHPRFALASEGAFSSVDVYHLLPQHCDELALEGWLALLHSTPVHLWLRRRGKRKGELLELYHTPLSSLPVPAHFDHDLARSLEFVGVQIHSIMTDINTIPDKKAWHLRWRDMRLADEPRLADLLELWDEADRLSAKAYGFSADVLKTIRKSLEKSSE